MCFVNTCREKETEGRDSTNCSFNKNKKSCINQHLKQFQATKCNQFLQKEGFLLNKFLEKYLAYSLQHLMAIVEASTTSSLSLSLVLFTISFSSLSRSFWSFFLFFFPSLWFGQCFAAGPLKMSREMDLYLCFKFYSWLDHCWRHHQIFFFFFVLFWLQITSGNAFP